jgi:hypothetical protein
MNVQTTLFTGMLCVLSAVVEHSSLSLAAGPPTAAMTADEVYQHAKQGYDNLKNFSVKYHISFRQLYKLPTDEAEGITYNLLPYDIELSVDGEKRKLTLIRSGDIKKPVDPTSTNPKTFVYDGAATVEVMAGKTAFIHRGKSDDVEKGDYYCSEVLGIPLTDEQRATYDDAWYYPHCIRGGPKMQVHYKVLPALEQVDGAWCYVLEAEGDDKLWIDPSIGFRIRKRERYIGPTNAVLLERAEFGGFVEAAPGVWLPKQWKRESFPSPRNPKEFWNKPYIEIDIIASNVTANDLTDDDFSVSLLHGGFVIDERTGASYKVPGASKDIMKVLTESGKKYVFDSKPAVLSEGTGINRTIFILVNVAVIVLVVVYLWFRRQRSDS